MQAEQPEPFEIVAAGDMRVASNGTVRLTLADPDGRLFRRRGVRGITQAAPAERLLPMVNALAGELAAHPDMGEAEIAARLCALSAAATTARPQNVEWAVAELDDVRVYASGEDIVVTRLDLTP